MKIKDKIKTLFLVGFVGLFCNMAEANASISVAEAFYTLARQNNTQKIERLLHRGYSLESNGEDGLNAVCLAVSQGDKKAYNTLVSYGAKKRPACLEKISKHVYRRFFGVNPYTPKVPVYTSDTPYNTGAVLLGIGAVATAVALKGSTGGGGGGSSSGGSGGGSSGGGSEDSDEEDKDKPGQGVNCPENSTYNPSTKKCDCNSGYDHFGDKTKCYKPIDNCITQQKNECKKCKTGLIAYKDKCVEPSECPENSIYNPATGACDCNAGYGHYGDARECYASIINCASQTKDRCSSCLGDYKLFDNECFQRIPNCQEQNRDTCVTCLENYDKHGGDGKACYLNIENCVEQIEDKCVTCKEGFGTHGNSSGCYPDVENCVTYNPGDYSLCMVCNPGYITHGDGKCYDENYCRAYPNSVPVDGQCICDASKGYTGDAYSAEGCTQADGGEYQEGEGNRDQWSNLNDKYCNSQGVYQPDTGICICYAGYAGKDCSSCSQEQVNGQNKYIAIDSRCYINLNCPEKKKNSIQSYNSCVCRDGFFDYEERCIAKLDCGKGKEQVGISEAPEVACQCKPNFIKDEETGECNCPVEPGVIEYDPLTDNCIVISNECEEENALGDKWTGEKCDICPVEYEITEDENGKRCGLSCAPNRLPIKENPDCSQCAEGYVYNKVASNCIISECEDGVNGYIKVEGVCMCDAKAGYAMSLAGICELKKEDYIGIKDTNINNGKISLNNDSEHRDVYGMKPELGVDEKGETLYYDSVYNALNYNGAEINIINNNTGNISIYGMYAPSVLYNSATTNDTLDTTSSGTINIKDEYSTSQIYGMKSDGINNVYNAFSYNTNPSGSNNVSTAKIDITKEETSNGQITGISGYNKIYNAFAGTEGGIKANSTASGNIKIENKGVGNVIGISNSSVSGKINNAYAYLDSAVSDVFATGNITLEGRSAVYGMVGSATMVNSETQFNKYYNIVNNFGAKGVINVTGHSDASGEGVFGMYAPQNSGSKVDIYNAMGYNSTGIINVSNTKGGSVYGIYSENERYAERDENGKIKTDENGSAIYLYNNIYNAFRSSKVYGGDNSAAKGEINLTIEGGNENNQSAMGIYTLGDAFNSYINSGSDIKLEASAEIAIADKSSSSNMIIKGLSAGGDKMANAYATGKNENNSSKSTGLIHIVKNGLGNSSSIYGMYNDLVNHSKGVKIYNAALIDDRATVEGTIKIEANRAPYKVYGIYAERGKDDGQLKTIYNAYYSNNTVFNDGKKGKVTGLIDVSTTSPSSGEQYVYGIYANESVAYNVYTSVPTDSDLSADITGIINVKSAGGNSASQVVGMAGTGINSALYNSTINSTINVEAINDGISFYNVAYGMNTISGYAENEGTINVKIGKKGNKTTNTFGIYTEDGVALNDKTGVINIEGNNVNYGMYALLKKDSTANSKLYNYGTINVKGGANNYGMYAKIETPDEGKQTLGTIEVENNGQINITGNGVGIYASGEGVTVKNSGSILITKSEDDVTDCTGDDCVGLGAISLNDGAEFITTGDVNAQGELNLDSFGGKVSIASNGSFNATEEIKGNLYVDTSTITDTFDKKTVIADAISAQKVDNLQLTSKSYLYDASIKENNNSKYDVEMNMKDFREVTTDDMADYYDKNYNQKQNSYLFNTLKKAQNKKEFNQNELDISGRYVLPNITEEELKVARSLDNKMLHELFKDKDNSIRRFVGADNVYIGRDTTSTLTGYELDAQSMYALYDKKINNKYRLGLGISFTNTNSDYDNDSSRDSFSAIGYIPLTYSINNNLTLASIARLGYQDGKYTRYGYNKKHYESDEKAFNYGLLNELRYQYNTKYFTISPFVGLNAIGWYYDSQEESGDALALALASSNVLSIEGALGLYLDIDKQISEHSKLTSSLGIGYYHEFANPYSQREAKIVNTLGRYKLKNSALDTRDRGVISAKLKYDYKDISIYGELMQYLEKEYPFSLDLGLQYKF